MSWVTTLPTAWISPDEGFWKGKVTDLIYKGAYYDIKILTDYCEWSVQSSLPATVGDMVGLKVIPYNIQIMNKPTSADEEVIREDEQ